MDEVKIEDGIPIPETRGVSLHLPWGKLEIGQSFRLEKGDRKESSFASMAGTANKRYGPKRFTSRKEGDGRRFWRIA